MKKQDAPSRKITKTVIQKLLQEVKRVQERSAKNMNSEVILAIIGVLLGVMANLSTANITEINFPTLILVFLGFVLLLSVTIVIMQRIYAPPSKIKLLSERIKKVYFEVLENSVLNPSRIKGE